MDSGPKGSWGLSSYCGEKRNRPQASATVSALGLEVDGAKGKIQVVQGWDSTKDVDI